MIMAKQFKPQIETKEPNIGQYRHIIERQAEVRAEVEKKDEILRSHYKIIK